MAPVEMETTGAPTDEQHGSVTKEPAGRDFEADWIFAEYVVEGSRHARVVRCRVKSFNERNPCR